MPRAPIQMPSTRATDQVVLYAFRSYRPHSYAGRVVLFRSTDRPPYEDAAAAWRELLGDGLEIHDVPGDHQTMFGEPHVGILAKDLQICLDAAQGAAAGDGRSVVLPG
jgi:thioesterase domain-containing protein